VIQTNAIGTHARKAVEGRQFMGQKENIQVAEKWIEALNAHDVNRLSEYRALGYLFQAPPFPGPVGPSEETAYTQGLFDAFSDFHLEVVETIAQDDRVVVNCTTTGTHNGPLAMPDGQTVPPTGKKMKIPCSITLHLANGKTAGNSLYYDQLGLMAQLGL
jgi:steroid delta-isomerase-like uncharacterized protein